MIFGGRQGGGRQEPSPAARRQQPQAGLFTLFALAGSRDELVDAMARAGRAETAPVTVPVARPVTVPVTSAAAGAVATVPVAVA